MSTRQIVVAAAWALSLVAASQWSARAEQASALPYMNFNTSGAEVRFVRQGNGVNGHLSGFLVANVNGRWQPIVVHEAR